MQNRTLRRTLLILIFAFAIGAGLVAWTAEQRVQLLSSSEQTELEHLNRLAELLSALGSVQLAYSASPQTDEGWFGHVSRLVERIEMESAAIGTSASSDEPSPPLRAFRDATAVVVQATARARDNLAAGRDVMAADLVLGETRGSVEAMGKSLRMLRTARVAEFDADRSALEQRAWTVVGAVAGIWAIALLVFARPQRSSLPSSPASDILSIRTPSEPVVISTPEPPPIDLAAAAALCTAISRVTTVDELPGLLARAASILDASGIILWMGVGEQLAAVGSHGYDAGLIARVSPIPLTARNPTTSAWHSGEICTIAGDGESHGAIAAPMSGPAGRVGVFAAELRNSREKDADARSVIQMIAAQCSTAFAPSLIAQAATLTADDQSSDLPLKAAGA